MSTTDTHHDRRASSGYAQRIATGAEWDEARLQTAVQLLRSPPRLHQHLEDVKTEEQDRKLHVASNYQNLTVSMISERVSHTEAEARPWQLVGEYDLEKLYSGKPAAMIAMKDGKDSNLAIRLSRTLVMSLEKAMRYSKTWQEIRTRDIEQYDLAKGDEAQNAKDLASIEGHIAEFSKKVQLDDDDKADLADARSERRCVLEAQHRIKDRLVELMNRKNRNEIERRNRWLDVERLLEPVWRNARIPLPEAEQPKPTVKDSNPSSQNQSIRQRVSNQEIIKKNAMEALKRFCAPPSDQQLRSQKAADWKANKWNIPSGMYSKSREHLVDVFDGENIVPALLVSRKLAEHIEEAIQYDRKYENLLSGGDKKRVLNPESWQWRLSKLVRLLDDIWVDAEIVQPYRSSANPQGQTAVPGTEGTVGHPHGRIFSALARVSRCHGDLIRARDHFDNYCYNYDRWAALYLESKQRSQPGSPTGIRDGFSRLFVKEVMRLKKKVWAARTHYLAAEDIARSVGIPRDCLGFAEAIDLQSCESIMTQESYTSERGSSEHGSSERSRLNPRNRVKAWLRSGSMAPISHQQSIVEDIPSQSNPAASMVGSHKSVQPNVIDDTIRGEHIAMEGDVEKRTHTSNARPQKQLPKTNATLNTKAQEHPRLEPGSGSPLHEGTKDPAAMKSKQEPKVNFKSSPVSGDTQARGPEVNFWQPAHGIRFSDRQVQASDLKDDSSASRALPVVAVPPEPKKRSIADFFKPRRDGHAPASQAVGSRTRKESPSVGERTAGEKRKQSSDVVSTSSKRRC